MSYRHCQATAALPLALAPGASGGHAALRGTSAALMLRRRAPRRLGRRGGAAGLPSPELTDAGAGRISPRGRRALTEPQPGCTGRKDVSSAGSADALRRGSPLSWGGPGGRLGSAAQMPSREAGPRPPATASGSLCAGARHAGRAAAPPEARRCSAPPGVRETPRQH